MKTLQETFNVIYTHLAQMTEKSKSLDGCGAYRGCGGNKCPIGVLITDENYNDNLEKRAANDKAVLGAIRKSGFPTENKAVVIYDAIQDTHDCRFHIRLESMKILARDYELSIPSLEH